MNGDASTTPSPTTPQGPSQGSAFVTPQAPSQGPAFVTPSTSTSRGTRPAATLVLRKGLTLQQAVAWSNAALMRLATSGRVQVPQLQTAYNVFQQAINRMVSQTYQANGAALGPAIPSAVGFAAELNRRLPYSPPILSVPARAFARSVLTQIGYDAAMAAYMDALIFNAGPLGPQNANMLLSRISAAPDMMRERGRRMLFQAGPAHVNVDDFTQGCMSPLATLEALQMIDRVAERFGVIAARRMLVSPDRAGRQVVMVEVSYDDARSGRDAIRSMSGICHHGILTSNLLLRDGTEPTGLYRVWITEFSRRVFNDLDQTPYTTSEQLEDGGHRINAMQMRWVGAPMYATFCGLPVLPSSPNGFPIDGSAHLDFPKLSQPQLARRRHGAFPPDAHQLSTYDILAGLDVRTTVMWKNLPPWVNAVHIISFLQWAVDGLFDFSYLRCCFSTANNIGYAFVNMTEAAYIMPLAYAIEHKEWTLLEPCNGKPNSAVKPAELSYAKDQSRDAMIDRFRNSAVMLQQWTQRPHLWYPLNHEQFPAEESFPPSNNATRLRTSQNNVGNGLYTPNRRVQHHRSGGSRGFPNGGRP